ncbi:signal peptidase II [Alloscardovia omnicolens]|uniref:signal peptidase II n=1 Tax=Alloscardovia omnicolens TaxID=419015 RepID=UPI003A62F696
MAVFLATFIVGVLLDQWTKSLALTHLTTSSDVPVLGPFVRLTLMHNPGASLGVGSSMTWLITVFALVVCLFLSVLGLTTRNLWWSSVCALTVSGALGNVIDRFMYADGFLNGTVVDFINYGPFVGNVADIVLTFAAVGMIGGVLLGQRFGVEWIDTLLFGHDDAESDQTSVQKQQEQTSDNSQDMTNNHGFEQHQIDHTSHKDTM